MSDMVQRFADLFQGRRNAYGTETGGCERTIATDWSTVPQANLWADHLNGTRPIGVYPMVPGIFRHGGEWIGPERGGLRDAAGNPDWACRWGCVDLDVKGPTHKTGYDTEQEAFDAALNLVKSLEHFRITGWIERTRSRGYHVWVFCTEWVPAATMRRALLVACAVADVPPTEVNPKAESFDSPDTLGNYVRLPYPGGENATTRRVASDGEWLSLEGFVDCAWALAARADELNVLAALYVPPRTETTIEVNGEVELDEALRRRLSGLTWTVLRDGPLEGRDRSGTLVRLAHLCQEDGLTPDETFAVLKAADESSWCQKFTNRRDGDQRLQEMVQRAWSK